MPSESDEDTRRLEAVAEAIRRDASLADANDPESLARLAIAVEEIRQQQALRRDLEAVKAQQNAEASARQQAAEIAEYKSSLMRDAHVDLHRPARPGSDAATSKAPDMSRGASRSRGAWIVAGVGLVLGLAIAAAVGWRLQSSSDTGPNKLTGRELAAAIDSGQEQTARSLVDIVTDSGVICDPKKGNEAFDGVLEYWPCYVSDARVELYRSHSELVARDNTYYLDNGFVILAGDRWQVLDRQTATHDAHAAMRKLQGQLGGRIFDAAVRAS